MLIKLDKDFGEHAVLHQRAHSGIVRLVAMGSQTQCELSARILERYGDELHRGALVTATLGHARIRTP